MKSLVTTLVLIASSLACASEPKVFALPTDHPASPLTHNPKLRSPSDIIDFAATSTPARGADTPSSQSDFYSCPMHPKVQQSEPGHCPECGMTLVKASEHHHDGGEQ
jgi:hypothetical protein